ncbi:hypothetical protein ABH926_009419 [Catenulispora sp. GP43]|uniref:hypothetical protein n=1 Tax=Catenulispora sp. GP43 TaxID=3156263 RepID=UPI003516D560
MNAPARVLNLLHAARPEDVAPVLSLLSDADLAAGLADEHCDPELRSVRPDRDALCHALLGPRRKTDDLLGEPGAVQDTLRLAARAPYEALLRDGITPYGRPRADLNRQLSAALTAALGAEPWRWFGVLRLADTWPRSFTDLLDEAAGWASESEPPDGTMRFRLPGELFLPGVVLALAPPAVVADVLVHTGRRSEGMLQGLLRHPPYLPAYREYAFGPDGSDYARQSLCASTGKPLALAHELLDHGMGPRYTALIAAAHNDLALRLRVHRDPDSAANRWRTSSLAQTTPEQVHALLSGAETADELYGLLTALKPLLRRNTEAGALRVFAYRRLGELAGPEPVWSVELDLAGGLTLMVHSAVRASMAGGGLAPLIAAAEAKTPPGPPEPAPNQGPLTEWPVEDAVRSHLDGRLDRWRALLGSSDEGAESALGLGQWATGQWVRPAGRGIEDLRQDTKTPPPADGNTDTITATATATATAEEDAA